MYDILFLGKDDAEWQQFKLHYPNAYRMPADSSWSDLKKQAFTKIFWVIWDELVFDHNFDLNNYRADEWDDMYVHVFKNGTTYNGVCLFPKSLNPSPREFYHRFFVKRKEVDQIISQPVKKDETFDVVFISYNEPNAEQNFRNLKKKVPNAKRVDGVKGIHQAHIEAAKQVETEMFYVVDGDAEILKDFKFTHSSDEFERDTVYVWRSVNPINELTYGYGGIKLLPTKLTLDMDTSKPDMTTSISKKFKPILEVSNITAFNTDPFNTWKSAFRECAKLASKTIDRQVNNETDERLKTWTTVGEDKPFGKYAIDGARAGMNFGGSTEDIGLINDFSWLQKQFEDTCER